MESHATWSLCLNNITLPNHPMSLVVRRMFDYLEFTSWHLEVTIILTKITSTYVNEAMENSLK